MDRSKRYDWFTVTKTMVDEKWSADEALAFLNRCRERYLYSHNVRHIVYTENITEVKIY